MSFCEYVLVLNIEIPISFYKMEFTAIRYLITVASMINVRNIPVYVYLVDR